MKKGATPKSSVTLRQVSGAVVADIVGEIALAEGTGLLRETVRNFLKHGHDRILLNGRCRLHRQRWVGELVRAHASIRTCRSAQACETERQRPQLAADDKAGSCV